MLYYSMSKQWLKILDAKLAKLKVFEASSEDFLYILRLGRE